jgi:hypothetical protein
MVWTCPTATDRRSNAQSIITDYSTFYDWLQSPDRVSCKTVNDSDVYNTLMVNRGNSSTRISDLNTEIKRTKEELERSRTEGDITKRRAAYSGAHPDNASNYYDGWFPLFRPMKHYSVVVLIAVSVFLFMITLILLLSIFGIRSQFSILLPEIRGRMSGLKIYGIFTGFIMILLGVIIYLVVRPK